MIRLLFTNFFLICAFFVASQHHTVLKAGNFNGTIEHSTILKNAQRFINEINSSSPEAYQNIDWTDILPNPIARKRMEDLWYNGMFRCLKDNLSVNILMISDNQFQIRNIPVIQIRDSVEQQLVLTFSVAGEIEGVHFGIEQSLYRSLLLEGINLDDIKRRTLILDHVESILTAFRRKDMEMLHEVFCQNFRQPMNNEVSSQQKHKNCLDELFPVLLQDAFLDVSVDSVKIMQKTQNETFYGVNISLSWNSSTHDDDGYLFLLFEIEDSNKALINFYAWQLKKNTRLEDVFEATDFDIMK